MPGELVEVEITEQKKDFAKSVVSKILEPHEKRRTPPCPYYGKCGGCNAQHAEFELQKEILREIVFDLFLRTAKLNLPQNFEIHSGAEWGYRHRAQFFQHGFLKRGSNTAVPIEKCLVLSDNLNMKLKENSNQKKHYAFDNQTEKLLGKHIHADETVFFQSNLELLPKLLHFVKEAAGEGSVLFDIFSGVGLFSAFLQDKFESVIAIEENENCLKFAEKNLNANCKFYAESAEKFFAKNSLDLNNACAIIDPPRPGLTNGLCNTLCKAKFQKLIYVSCNPATLARDTRKFLNAGYKLANIHGFAFYPQTFHLEMMAEFSL